jgi:hypothetical protein
MTVPTLYGLFAQCLVVAAAARVARELFAPRLPRLPHLEFLFIAAVVALTTVDGVSLAAHLRGLWGDPSIVTSLVLFAYAVSGRSLPARPTRTTAFAIAASALLLLYLPATIGLTYNGIDPYAVGLRPWLLIAIVFVGAVAGWRRVDLAWIRCVAWALLAYGMQVMESDNLWDYLVDPGLVLGLVLVACVTPASQERGVASLTAPAH